MASLGKWNTLEIIRESPQGLYLEGDKLGDILMPNKYVYKGCKVGETADVFVYSDSQDRLIATTETPHAVAGEFAYLSCVATSKIGAFFDMGLLKDLLVPFARQQQRIEEKKKYIVYIEADPVSNRLVGSTNLQKYIEHEPTQYKEEDPVEIIITEERERGFKAIINHHAWGMLYHNEVFQELKIGQKIPAYVTFVREDGKIDLSLYPPVEKKVEDLTKIILTRLEQQEQGVLNLSDKSPKEEIYQQFQVSKKTFKKALGQLYKAKKISISPSSISLN